MMNKNLYLLEKANKELDKLQGFDLNTATSKDIQTMSDVIDNITDIVDEIRGGKTERFTIDDLNRLWIGGK